jgi:hypothetical protein
MNTKIFFPSGTVVCEDILYKNTATIEITFACGNCVAVLVETIILQIFGTH